MVYFAGLVLLPAFNVPSGECKFSTMRNRFGLLLQIALVLVGFIILFLLIRLPQTEGRASNLTMFQIYSDPFILYGYGIAAVYFYSLSQIIRLIGYYRINQLVSHAAIKTVRTIQYCFGSAVVMVGFAGLYIRLHHHKDDDPAGFLAICILVILVSLTITFLAGYY